MTDARVTQGANLALTQGDDETRVTQGAVLALVQQSAVGSRVTQGANLALVQGSGPPGDGARVTQLPALVLCQSVPCNTYWVQTWKITRQDGTVHRFTDHDKDVSFQGQTFSPCESLSASAAELAAFAGQIGSQSLAGIVADDGISEADLYAGKLDGATVEVWIVPWSSVGGQIPRRLFFGTVEGVQHGQHGYTAEVLTPGALLQQRALLEHYTAACRWTLGTSPCPVDLGPLTVAGTVSHIATVDAGNRAKRRVFRDSSRAEAAGHFDLGLLTWTSGRNNGVAREVKSFTADGTFTLWEPLLHEIRVGETYTVYPGCAKTEDDHVNKFGLDMDAYGGFPHVPGRDVISQTPDAK